MKILIIFLFLTIPSWAAISEISAAECSNAAGTSCTLGTHKAGDVAILIGTRVSSTAPSLPAGCTNIHGAGANTWSLRVCWYVLNGTETTSKALTNANQMSALVFRGVDLANTTVATFGGTAVYTSASSTTMSYCGTTGGTGCSTLTFTRSDGTSWLIGVGTCASCTAGNVAPSGMTNIAALSTTTMAINDTVGGVSAWTTQNVTVTTAGALRGIVIELLAAPSPTACSANCPTFITGRSWGTNDSVVASNNYTASAPEAAIGGTGDVQVCGFDVAGTVAGAPTITGTFGGDSFTITKVTDDGTNVAGIAYIVGPTSGDQVLNFALGTSEQQMIFQCYEFEYAGAVDAGPIGQEITGTSLYSVASPGSLTTTQANDLIVHFVFVAGGGNCCQNFSTLFQPGGGWNLLPTPFHQLGMASQFITWGSTGAINPAMFISTPSGQNTYQSVAIAFKNSSTGSTPTGGRIQCVGMLANTAAGAYQQQSPCPATFATPNTIAYTSNAQTADTNITSITDSDSNTYTPVTNAAGYPQAGYVQNATFTNSNSRYMIINNTGTNSPVVFYTLSGMATSGLFDATASTTATGTQTSKAASNTTCTNNANFNSVATYTPTVANEIMLVAEYTGTGPECGVSSTNNIFDTMWYHTESDADSYNTAGSGYGHLRNSTTAMQTFTFNWANSAAAGGSGWAMRLMVLKPAATGGSSFVSGPLIGQGIP